MAENIKEPTISLSAFYNAVTPQFSLAAHHIIPCMALEDRRIDQLALIIGPGSGKSHLLDAVYPAWRLGEDPTSTILAISAGEDLVKGFMVAAGTIIQQSPHFRRLYPNVWPDMDAGWSRDSGLNVTGRELGNANPSYLACGLASKQLTGKHAREIVCDDLHDELNAATMASCQKVINTYYTTIMGRGDARGTRTVLAGRRWSRHDLYGHLTASGDWVVLRLPAERPKSFDLYYDVFVPEGLECVFTEKLKNPIRIPSKGKPVLQYRAYYGKDQTGDGFYWPASAFKKREYFRVKTGTPIIAKAVYGCDPDESDAKVFIEDDFSERFEFPTADELALGKQSAVVRDWIDELGGYVVQVWDTAEGASVSSANSACITMLLKPCNQWHRDNDEDLAHGTCERHNDVYILDVWANNVDPGALLKEAMRQHNKWTPRHLLIENKSTGVSLIQSLRNVSGVNLRPVKANRGKVERAVDAIGGGAFSVQGWARLKRVRFPTDAPWFADYKAEMLDFGPGSTSKKDRVDATVHGIAFAIESALGEVRIPSEQLMREIQGQASGSGGSSAFASAFGAVLGNAGASMVDSGPAGALGGSKCSRCAEWAPNTKQQARNWCTKHAMPTTSLDSCGDWRQIAVAEITQQGW